MANQQVKGERLAGVPKERSRLGKVILALSSAGGLGYLPRAPGTWGTLAALPIWYALRHVPWPIFAAVVVLATGFAIFISHHAERLYGAHDVQHIVIDEVVGLLATVVGVPWAWPQVLSAFVLFRLLDALKPPPICYVDRHLPGGAGVVLDDTLAGIIGCALLHGARLAWGGWW